MDSPDRNHTISSSATQGSPFFNYLCSLSPIRPVKSVHVAQTFSELNFPPPPPVFTSPRVSSQKELSFLNRPPHKGMEYEENRIFSSSSCEKGKELMVPLSGCDMSASLISPVTGEVTSFETSASNQTKSKDKSMPTFFGCSPSRYVEQYLVDPVEEELYMVDSSELCSKPASPGLAEVPVVESGSPEDTVTSQCSKRKGIEEISQSNSSEGFVDADKNSAEAEIPQGYDENPLVANSEETMKASDVRKIGQANIKSNEKMRSILSDLPPDHSHTFKCANHYISSHTDARHDKNSVDPTTSGFAFLLSKDSTCKTDEWQKALSTDCLKISCQQVSENPVKGDDGDSRHSDLDNTPQPVQDAKSGADLDMKVDPESNCPMEHNTSLGCKASDQQHRGMRRRCLDFEASEASKKNLGSSSWKPMSLISKTGALVNSHDLEKNAMPSMLCESSGTSDCKQLVISLKRETSADTRRCSQSSSSGRFSSCSYKASDFTSHKIECSVRKNGNSSVTVGMPSGIGLHLNSLATSMSSGCGVSMLTSAKRSVSMKGMGPLSGIREASSDGLGSCVLSVSSGRTLAIGSSADLVPGMVVSVMEKTRMGRQEHQSSEVAHTGVTKSTTCLRSVTVGIKPLHSRLPLKAEERNSSPLGKKRPPLQDISQQPAFGVGEEFNQSSPKKRRRKSATIADKQGCKRCNCKKSKCLKLYCECFAAGVYCVEPCTCQECLNKPEHEDMVLGTRQQIESRNPLAFAPKIIRDGDSPPTNGEECSETPASARHKRGCNCKKSMCLKKYCECYQAGVGCSEGCRCEGCKNIYGKKEGSDEIEDKAAQFEEWDKESPEEKLGVPEVRNNSMHLEQQHAKDLSPITPSFQHACQGRSTVKVGPSGRRCFTSEDLESPPVSQSCAKPPRSPGRILRSTKGIQGNGTAIHSHKAGSKCSASLGFTPKTEKAGQFSPQWDGLRDICTVTPLPQPPLRPAAVDVSVVEGVEASPLHEQQNEISGSSSGHLMSRHSCPGGAPSFFVQPAARSPVCTSDILSGQMPVNQTTPVTPALSTAVCNAENKLGVSSESYIESHHISGCPEDDTPDILKDNGSPVSILKASSPNQKRVSPPHNYCLEKMTSRRPISSSGLRSNMEFIRQSVPQFPPLTPPLDEGQANINSRTE